jgi:DNA-binding protein HU-beta
LPHSSRGWTGARTPSAVKRVRQAQRRRLINQPRRTAAKTLIAKALGAASDAVTNGTDSAEVQQAVERAVSALDKAAKIGAIHPNAADRRKSRLMLKVNATLGGEVSTGVAKAARQTGKLAAAKQAKARIAAGRATKAKGAQTAAGKARAALARTSRETTTGTDASATPESTSSTAPKATAKAPAAKAGTTKASATKSAAAKTTATKATATKATAKSPAKKTTKAAAKKS